MRSGRSSTSTSPRRTTNRSLRVGSRGSRLALIQTDIAVAALRAASDGLDVEVVPIATQGDRIKDRPYEDIGPRGIFAVELQEALLDGTIDVAVHSLKDLASSEPGGLVLAAVCEREDARDVLVSRDGTGLADLPAGAVVGTSSVRRRVLISRLRPDLETATLRGNVDTRLEKVRAGEVDAAVLAAAGLIRLGRADAVTEWFDPLDFIPPPGQGAIVIEARADRFAGDQAWVVGAEHARTRACIDAEREFMRLAEGNCDIPLGAWARYDGEELVCDGFIARDDGSRFARASVRGLDPVALGAELARRVLPGGDR